MVLAPQQAVVLIHGLWMGRLSLSGIAKSLRSKGYKIYLFNYKSTNRSFAFNIEKLQALVNSRDETIVHLVGHSMGGILSMRSLPLIRKEGKLVMLGSPVNGSQAAVAMGRKRYTSWLLKNAKEPLENGVINPQVFRQSLMIAGTSNSLGIGRLVTKLPKPNDGTVALNETIADWIGRHSTENTNHFRMLFNKNINQKIADFLK